MIIKYGELSNSLEKKILAESFTPTEPEVEKCCLCGNPIEGYGNNASPLATGRCCDACNMDVIQARMNLFDDAMNFTEPEANLEECNFAKRRREPVRESVNPRRNHSKNHRMGKRVTESVAPVPKKPMCEYEAKYRELASLDESVEITEENIDPWALSRAACTKCCTKDMMRNKILHKEQ